MRASASVEFSIQATGRLARTYHDSQHDDPIPDVLSDEAMRAIQALSQRLTKLRQQLAGARQQEEQVAALREARRCRYDSLMDRREQAAAELEQTRGEYLEVSRQEKEVKKQVETSERHLEAAQDQQERCLTRAQYEPLKQEFDRLRSQLVEARCEGEEIRAKIAREQKRAEAKQNEKQRAKDMSEEQEEASRDELEAQSLSHRRHVGPSLEKHKVLRAERCACLLEQREQLEQHMKRCSDQSLTLEARMECVRARNRQLEVSLRRSQEADDREFAGMREDGRRRAQQIRLLSDLLRVPLSDQPPRAVLQSCAVPAEFSLERASRAMYARKCIEDAAAKGRELECRKSEGIHTLMQTPAPGCAQLGDMGVARDAMCELVEPRSQASSSSCQEANHQLISGDACGSWEDTWLAISTSDIHNFEVSLHDEEYDIAQPTSVTVVGHSYDFNHASEPEMVSDAVLVYNPRTQSSHHEGAAAPGMTAQHQRIQQLQKLTEGWDTGLSGDSWSVGSGGTRSGDSLSTDLYGPLMSLQEESLGSAWSETCSDGEDTAE